MSRPARPLLYALTAGAALGEAIGLRATGMLATLPLAAQASAVAPLMAFHDDRWLFVYADSWPVLAAELAAAVVVRAVMCAVCVRAAWPRGARPPKSVPLLGRCAAAYVVLVVAMSPWALLSFVTAVTSVSYPLIGGIAGAGILAVFVLPHAGVGRWWWARLPPWRAMAWTAADIVVATAGAVGIAYSPGWAALAPAAVAGLLNGYCWQRLVEACAARHARAWSPGKLRLTAVPAWSAVAVAGLAVLMASIVPYIGREFPVQRHLSQAPPRRGERAVLLVDGYQSRWDGGPPVDRFPGFYTTEFSYRGLGGSHDRPLPYASRATTQSLSILTRRFTAQVDRLWRATRREVDVVAVSEGTFILRTYLSHVRPPRIRTVVLASPLPRPDRDYLPPEGEPGYGIAASTEIGALLDISRAEQPTLDVGIDMPVVRSLLADGPLFRQRSLCPVPGVRIVVLLPLTAAIDDPPGPLGGVPAGVVPALHATLLETATVRREVVAVLHGRRTGRFFGWGIGFQLLRFAASAGETPSLPLGLVPQWRRAGGTRWGDAAMGTYGCPAVDHPFG